MAESKRTWEMSERSSAIVTVLVLWSDWRFSTCPRRSTLWFLSTIESTYPRNSLLPSLTWPWELAVRWIERRWSRSAPERKRRGSMFVPLEAKRTLVRTLLATDGAVTLLVLTVGMDGCWAIGLATDALCSNKLEKRFARWAEANDIYQRHWANGSERVGRSGEWCFPQSWWSRRIYSIENHERILVWSMIKLNLENEK